MPVGQVPLTVASGDGAIWVCLRGGTVAQIDATARQLVKKIDVGTDCNDVAVGFGSVWVAGGWDGSLVRIEPDLGEPKTVPLPAHGADSRLPLLWVAVGAGSVWAAQGNSLLQIDPADNHLVQTIEIRPAPLALAAGRSYAWVVTDKPDNLSLRFDALGRRYPEIQLPAYSGSGSSAGSPAASFDPAASDDVWLLVYGDLGEVRRYRSGGPMALKRIDGYPLDVAVGAGAAWVVNLAGTVWRLDPALTTVEKRIPTAPTSRSSLAVGYGAVWVAIQQPTWTA